MARRIRTRDQLPRAAARADRAKARVQLGIDLSSSADRTAITTGKVKRNGRVTFHGVEIIENPALSDGEMILANRESITNAVREALRGFDFRKLHNAD